MSLYELALMGAPSDEQVRELAHCLSSAINPFGLRLGEEVGWSIRPTRFDPSQTTAAAVAFFGGVNVSEEGLSAVLRSDIPVLPVAYAEGRFEMEIPPQLRALNGLSYSTAGALRISTALLECVGLLPRQRRVFVSYRRGEARSAALQLFDALSSRLFDVFLDTHGIPPAEDFQAALWHRLCDSDVLVMLDTPSYFESRWTSAEFGRALAKLISVLRVGWPNVTPSHRTLLSKGRVDLSENEIELDSGQLTERAIDRICTQVEALRSESIAVRSVNLVSRLRLAVECIGGSVVGVGPHKGVYVSLPDDTNIVVYPAVGVPTSLTLHDAVEHTPGRSVGIIYDHVGLSEKWLEHLAWLGRNVQIARWVKVSEAAWSFADWR